MLCVGAFTVAAEETTKLIWDMEDKAVISQLVTIDTQKATIVQSTQQKRNGAASLMFVNTGKSGLMGNIVPLVDVDLTGWDIIRFYVSNPTDMETGLRFQFCGGMVGNTAYFLDVEVPTQTDGFVAVDFPLDQFQPIKYFGMFYDIAQPYEYIIADSALIFTGPNSGERIYIDDVMLVKESKDAPTTTKKADKTTTKKPTNTTAAATTTKRAEGTTATATTTTATQAEDTTTAPVAGEVTQATTTTTAAADVSDVPSDAPEKPEGGFPVWVILVIVAASLLAACVGVILGKKFR